MALVPIGRGLFYPPFESPVSGAVGVVDLATEKFAMIGHLYFEGRQSGAKTFSTGSIQWRAGTAVWATSPTAMDIGIQGVTATGPIARPNGTFTVKRTVSAPTGIVTSSWITTVMNSGSASLTHGDLIAVVWDMTARAGSDSVQITGQNPPYVANLVGGFPITNAYLSGAWQTTGSTGNASKWPDVILVMDDGTMGTIAPTIPFNSQGTEQFLSTTNPDERGLVFQAPFDCTIDGLWAFGGFADANGDFNLKFYSNPTSGTPTQLGTVAVQAEQAGQTANDSIIYKPITPVNLTKNTDYLVTMEATGSGNVRLAITTLASTDHRAFYPGSTTLKKATRQNATGAFAIESPAVTIYRMGVMISHVDDGGSPPPTYGLGV